MASPPRLKGGVGLPEIPCSWPEIECSKGLYVVKLSLENIGSKAQRRSRKLLQDPFFGFPFVPFPPPPPPPQPGQDLPPPLQSPSADGAEAPSPSPDDVITTPSPSPSPSPSGLPFSPSHVGPSPAELPRAMRHYSKNGHHELVVISSAILGPLLLFLAIFGFYFVKSGKIATVKPWRTGLSGQLQKAFITGVPKLKRAELQAACEDFSNVIGSLPFCTLYKGTLSSGVEIAVASISAGASAKDWSNVLEAQFRTKIETLSKVNHKNFVSILGYCEEEEPFTRMMVFEYAPNGTFFEHLHVKESEHLDWATRMRIAMGVIYCIEHMHGLDPPSPHNDLNSSSVYLTEDYAAKISNFTFSDESSSSYSEVEINLKNDVYSFGTLLFEMVTGKLLHSAGRGDSLQDWLFDYINGEKRLSEMVDGTLETYREDQLQQIDVVIKSCCNEDWRHRPSVREVCTRLKEITSIGPHEAIPNRSPLWWAELEILSTEAAS